MFSMMPAKPLHPGDRVVFASDKRSAHPGARAKDIRPELHGEGYFYIVDKFWIVQETRGPQVLLTTRRGKIHLVDSDDPRLHRATWWQRLIYRNRFPKMHVESSQDGLAV